MRVASIQSLMTRKVVSVEPECPILEVLNKFRAYHISCVLVCEGDMPIGIISESDIVGIAYDRVSGYGEQREQARDLMSPTLTTVSENGSFEDAVALAEEQRIRHLPVVDDAGRLVGLLTQTDMLRAALARIP
jgi:CBS domain-containing protein